MLDSRRSGRLVSTVYSTPDSALRYLSALLALAYPVTAYFAVARHSFSLTLAAIAVLAAAVLLPSLIRGRLAAWIALPCVVACLWWLARSPINLLTLYAPPVLVPAFLAWVFGHTLAKEQTPLISQLVRLLHPPEEPLDEAVWPYARRLTLAWSALLAAIAIANLMLAALATPDGLLMAAGVTPPFTVPQQAWSLFANVLGYLLVAAFFMVEYAYRRRRFPQQPYRNFFDFLGRTIAASPRLLSRDSSESGVGALVTEHRTAHAPLRIPHNHPALPGHFPGQPIVPGVVLLDQVLQATQSWLGDQVRLHSLQQVKFLAPLLADQDAQIQLTLQGADLRFTITRAAEVIAQGVMRVAVGASA